MIRHYRMLKQVNWTTARKALSVKCRATAKPDKTGMREHQVLKPSNSQHNNKIKYFKRINEEIKKNFINNKLWKDETCQRFASEGCSRESRPRLASGRFWDRILSNRIMNREEQPITDSSPRNEKAAQALLEAVESTDFNGKYIKLIHDHLPLYGYMYAQEGNHNLFLWQGYADAIGWYDGRYVIVDWKVVELQSYWDKNKDVFGMHLHQCLVYARLLQCIMKLDYIPYILIVPIDGSNDMDFFPGLFTDYPKECKDEIDSFNWSVEIPDTSLMIHLKKYEDIFKEQTSLEGLNEKKLGDLFKESTTWEDLINIFNIPPHKFKNGG